MKFGKRPASDRGRNMAGTRSSICKVNGTARADVSPARSVEPLSFWTQRSLQTSREASWSSTEDNFPSRQLKRATRDSVTPNQEIEPTLVAGSAMNVAIVAGPDWCNRNAYANVKKG